MGERTSRRARRWSVATVAAAVSLIALAGVAAAGIGIKVKGNGAAVSCNGGMSHLSHVFDENASVFPGDPAPQIDVIFTVDPDGFLLEEVTSGTHTGTHFDAPGHFIEGGRTVDELAPEEFVWPAYVVDVRDRIASEGGDFQLSIEDIEAYEKQHGKIERGSMVVIQTGWDSKFGIDGFDADGNVLDDYVDDLAPGFSGAAVQWMFDERKVRGVGSDTLGPDAYTDELFDATFTALLNDGVALPGLNNLDSLAVKGDVIIAPAVRLADGSGYQVNALGCLGGGERRDRDPARTD
jgi:kynurenine formamidase